MESKDLMGFWEHSDSVMKCQQSAQAARSNSMGGAGLEDLGAVYARLLERGLCREHYGRSLIPSFFFFFFKMIALIYPKSISR